MLTINGEPAIPIHKSQNSVMYMAETEEFPNTMLTERQSIKLYK